MSSYSGQGWEPDYEGMMEDREEERGERYLTRMDTLYGRIEDYRYPIQGAQGE